MSQLVQKICSADFYDVCFRRNFRQASRNDYKTPEIIPESKDEFDVIESLRIKPKEASEVSKEKEIMIGCFCRFNSFHKF